MRSLGLLTLAAFLGPAAPSLALSPEKPCGDLETRCFVDLPTGIRTAFVETGPADGRTVILLHGLTDSARSFQKTFESLKAADPALHVVAIDQRGHGQSSMPPGEPCAADPKTCFTPALFAADLDAFMEARGIAKALIVGHSMGSIVAQEMALAHPGRVEGIVLIATTAKSAGNAVIADYVLREPVLGAWKAGLDAKGITTPAAVYAATPLDADPKAENWIAANWDVDPAADPAIVAKIAAETSVVKIGTWIGATEALLAADNTARLPDLQVPVLVLWGTQDAIFYRDPDQTGMIAALGKAAAAHGTKAFWKRYGVDPLPASGAQDSDIGHNVQWDAPEAVAADILAFLKTGRPTAEGYRASISNGASRLETVPGGAEIVEAK